MRTKSLLIALGAAAALVGACGDNHVDTTPDATPKPACSDGIDNDGDGLIDYPDDPGCSDANSDTEDGTVKPQCDDGRDNDGDGLIDFPMDPGCFAPLADSEEDDCPLGAGCPQCANGIDDDGNGMTDYPDDIGCTSASDPFEFTENPNACGASLMIKNLPPTGTDQGMLDTTSTSDLVPSCGGVANAPAIAYLVNLPEPKVMVATTTGSTVNTVLMLRGANCQDSQSEIACNDNISSSNNSSSITRSLAAGSYYLIVSGATTSATGAYMLDVMFFTGEGETCADTAECGPGLVCRTPVGETEMQCAQPVCNDGIDDDNDGLTDYPNDPGCASPDDDDETDDCPTGPNCPECANDLDDDNDGLTDYPDDPSCTSASGNSEACDDERDPIIALSMPITQSTLLGTQHDHSPSCGSTNGIDRMFTLRVPELLSLKIDTEVTSVDTVVSLLPATCSEPALACNDDGFATGRGSLITLSNVAAGNYVVAVNAFSSTTTIGTGNFDLRVGGVIAPGGSCEPEVLLGGAFACPVAFPCEGTPGSMRCQLSACSDGIDNDGDGKIDYPEEPGCDSLLDDDESDTCPAGPGCPQCSDLIDNDANGETDYPDDPTCAFAGDNREGCVSTEAVIPLTQPVTAGSTSSATHDVVPSCNSSNTARDLTYRLEIPTLTALELNVTFPGSSFDSVTALYDSTCGASLRCSDPAAMNVGPIAGGTYFFVVDGWNSASGSYNINVIGKIANGESCESPLAQSGALTCGTGHACAGAVGSRTCQPAACNDGVDNDSDGKIDYPEDPGCVSINDDDEADDCPDGPNCPECSDEVDNDGDMTIDYPADTSCAAASSSSEACVASESVDEIVNAVTSGTTVGKTHDFMPSCASSTNTAPDVTYRLNLPDVSALQINLTNLTGGIDSVHTLLDATCGPAELLCSDPVNMNAGARAAGTYYLVVDGWGTTSGGYNINVSGTIAAGGSCEVPLAQSGALTCGAGYACSGTAGSRTCQPTACNNGIDDDGDLKIDYPNDPGCASISDDDEADDCPSGPNCPQCSDGQDNDGDSLIDYPADPACSSAASPSEQPCASTEAIAELVMSGTTGTTENATHDYKPSCNTSNTAPDHTYLLRLPEVTALSINLTGLDYDSVHTLLDSTCGAPDLQCSDAASMNAGARPAGTYYLVVDGWASDSGTYTINVSGTIADGGSCEVPLAQSGALRCGGDLVCGGPMGSRTCRPAACSNGIDDDADGIIDYPNEPGCESVRDDDETDPVPPAVCSNGLDDDMDGLIDYPDDPGCASAGSGLESGCPQETDPQILVTTPVYNGMMTSGHSNDFASSMCFSSTLGRDVVHTLQLPVPVANLVVQTIGDLDFILGIRDAVCGVEHVCADASITADEIVMLSNVQPGEYQIVVDTWTSTSTPDVGPYTLTVKGTVAAGTACDSPLFTSGVLVCPTGTTCNGTTLVCQ